MKNLMYTIGITAFLACGIFNVTATLNNPFFGMSHIALAQGSWSGGSGCGSIDPLVIQCAPAGQPYGCCMKCETILWPFPFRDCQYTGYSGDYCSLSCGP